MLTVPWSVVWDCGWLQPRPDCTRVAAQQAACTLPWIGANNPVEGQRLQADYNSKMQQVQDFQLGGSEKHLGTDDRGGKRRPSRTLVY